MPRVEVELSAPIHDSFHVKQIAGMFDVPLAETSTRSFSVEVPGIEESWQIGLIVGPSASGKTSLARAAFGSRLFGEAAWPHDRAVIDAFAAMPTRQATALLTSVGFGSPPAWIRPYHTLSRGEQFRCNLARALAAAWSDTSGSPAVPPLVVFDEFTSVVDRTVARIGSAAVAKAIRGGRVPCRFVAVTCHSDVARWLEPDWVVDMHTRRCQRRRLRRPPLELAIRRCHRRHWTVFAPHHYLSGALNRAAHCYLATWRRRPVAFCGMLPAIGRRNHWRISRIVTLPDYQGLGIGPRVAEAVCDLYRSAGCRTSVTATHPALVAHCARSPRWRRTRLLPFGSGQATHLACGYRSSAGRSVVSFEYLGGQP